MVMLMLAFDSFMSRRLQKRPLNEVLADYDLSKSRAWSLFLGWIAVAQCLFYFLQKAPV